MLKINTTWKIIFERVSGELGVGFVEAFSLQSAKFLFVMKADNDLFTIHQCTDTEKLMTEDEIKEETENFHYRTPII